MAINEEIARLTGTLKFVADYRPLIAFEKRLASVEGKLRAFSELANKKFNIKVTLDAKSVREQLDKLSLAKVTFKNFTVDSAAVLAVSKGIADKLNKTPLVLSNVRLNITGVLRQLAQLRKALASTDGVKVVFKNFHVDGVALSRASKVISERLGNTPVQLKNVKISISEVLGQRALLRGQLAKTPVEVGMVLKFKQAEAQLRAWKAATESRFKLHINADISGAKLLANARATLRRVGAQLGTLTIRGNAIRLSIDRAHLRSEIAAVLAQIRREVRIKLDLNSVVSGHPRTVREGVGSGRGLLGGGLAVGGGLLGGLGAFAGLASLNRINQQMQGQKNALTAVTGSQEAGAETQKRLDSMGEEIGFNTREMAPSFIKMIASGQGSGFTQAQSEQVFKSMTEYGRVMGLNSEEMKGSLRAVEQMMNKGQIMSEELKGQLGERFPAAVSLMAEATGKTIPELLESMKKGEVKSDVLLKFAEIISKKARVGGALDAAKDSTAANQQRFGNQVTRSVGSFSAGGFDSATNGFFRSLAKNLKQSQPLIESLGAAFEILVQPVMAVINLLGNLAAKWPDLASGLGMTSKQLSTIAALATALLLPFGSVALAIGAIVLAIEDLMVFNQGGVSVFGNWLKESAEAKVAFDELKASFDSLKASLTTLFDVDGNKDLEEMSNRLKENFATINFNDMFIQTMRELKLIMDFVSSVINRMVSANDYAKKTVPADAGEMQQSFQFMKGLSMNPEEQKADIANQIAQGYINPANTLSASDLARDALAKSERKYPVLPGINTPLAGGEHGYVPQDQAGPGMLQGFGQGVGTKIEHHGQIIIHIDPSSDGSVATQVREQLQKVFNSYLPKEVK